jgi:hypothetical protein
MYGIKRSLAYELLKDGLIRGVTLRRPGTIRGKRLFNCNSIRAYLAKQPSDATPEMREKAQHANRQRGKKEATPK